MFDYTAFLAPDRVAVVDALPSRKTALHQLAEYLAKGTPPITAREIFFKLEEREREGSTVLDELPIAIPHCRMPNCPSPLGALLKVRNGTAVAFGGQNVPLMIGMCFPEDGAEVALEVLRMIVRLLEDEQRMHELLAAASSASLYEIFRSGLLAEAAA